MKAEVRFYEEEIINSQDGSYVGKTKSIWTLVINEVAVWTSSSQLDSAAMYLIAQNLDKKGAWFVFGWDMMPYPIGLFDNEIEALRLIAYDGHGSVKFWEYGTLWEN